MIKKIVKEVFKKAEREYASKAKTTLSKYIADKIEEEFNIIISDRTLSRSYDRYILSKKNTVSLTAESVDLLCKYLGFNNYSDYKAKNSSVVSKIKNPFYVIPIISILLVFFLYKNNSNIFNTTECMVWESTEYVKISCHKEYHPKYGTKVIVMDKKMQQNLKKVVLKRSSIVFSQDGKPLFWYSKLKKNNVEFFTAPGLHPITGETLKKISKTIFNKYVPIHTNNKNSFK